MDEQNPVENIKNKECKRKCHSGENINSWSTDVTLARDRRIVFVMRSALWLVSCLVRELDVWAGRGAGVGVSVGSGITALLERAKALLVELLVFWWFGNAGFLMALRSVTILKKDSCFTNKSKKCAHFLNIPFLIVVFRNRVKYFALRISQKRTTNNNCKISLKIDFTVFDS